MRSRRVNRPAQNQRRGALTVEFALTLPLYFTLLFAAFEFARVNTVLHTMENAAYEGARQGVVPGASADQAEEAAHDALTPLAIQNATATVSPSTLTGLEDEITVTISVPLNDNTWVTPVYFADVTLTRSCTLSTERRLSGQ